MKSFKRKQLPKSTVVKIRRFGDAFWVTDVCEIDRGVFVGMINNHLMTNDAKFNDKIAFCVEEIIDWMGDDAPLRPVRRFHSTFLN